MLRRVIECGFTCVTFFWRDPWLDSLRGNPEFDALIAQAEAGYRDAAAAFVVAGGEQMLEPGIKSDRVMQKAKFKMPKQTPH